MLTTLPVLLALAQAAPSAPLPEGNAYVRALVSRQRSREEALNRYTYDVEEIEEELDGKGLVPQDGDPALRGLPRQGPPHPEAGGPERPPPRGRGRPEGGAAGQGEGGRRPRRPHRPRAAGSAALPGAGALRLPGGGTGRGGRTADPRLFLRARCRASAISRPTSSCGGWPAASGWTRRSASSCARRCATPTRSSWRSAWAPRCRAST